ncbi:MAG: T9SS type A sorting domain-containing protein [Bacteroidetes bacterium]|nr:T9SS type A sorting domain-containing protein [Bacteroidota bacterium]
MKHLFLFFCLISATNCSAQFINSISNGSFYSASTWDCSCVPGDGDSIRITHLVALDSDLHFQSGKIIVQAPGQFLQDAFERTLWLDGTSNLYNSGTLGINKIRISNEADVYNNLNFVSVDSLINEANLTNNSSMEVSVIVNKAGAILDKNGSITASNTIYNQGYFEHSGTMQIYQNFENCLESGNAVLNFSGTTCIVGNFINCESDSVQGPGVMNISGFAQNDGIISGPSVWHVAAGSIENTGIIASNVTINAGSCFLTSSGEEPKEFKVSSFPNPCSDLLKLNSGKSGKQFEYLIFNSQGSIVLSGKTVNESIDVSSLSPGIYLLNFPDESTSKGHLVIKQ